MEIVFLVFTCVVLAICIILLKRLLIHVYKSAFGVYEEEEEKRRKQRDLLLNPKWKEYEKYLGWVVPEEFKMKYLESVKSDPPLLLYNDTEFLFFAIDGFSEEVQDVAIAWGEFGEPVYFKRGAEHAHKLYIFTEGQEEILIEDTTKL